MLKKKKLFVFILFVIVFFFLLLLLKISKNTPFLSFSLTFLKKNLSLFSSPSLLCIISFVFSLSFFTVECEKREKKNQIKRKKNLSLVFCVSFSTISLFFIFYFCISIIEFKKKKTTWGKKKIGSSLFKEQKSFL
jgi:hypothetical protein